ncbi:putative metal-binding protein [Rubidibacter lacunae KORDI 51-2]|uniref:Putative metal-binding protein n=1 Tax=Rubidibacter lacunae KORDI 51-2 TaxID=582515 RepID=U5DMI9_9CHRO|nr:DUF1636 domain-containing protein [Rubidibacter lacunae]ERN41819.1 putative metal-binding protein [Rubidibacter lacunae KORDI 51-2]
MTQHTLFVCTTCASTWENGKRVGISGGERLLAQLAQQHAEWELREQFTLQPVSCMSACDRPCAVAFAAPGKHTFVFGKLSADEATLPEKAAAVLNCAELYFEKPDGLLAWAERPKPMRTVVSRVPPLSAARSA